MEAVQNELARSIVQFLLLAKHSVPLKQDRDFKDITYFVSAFEKLLEVMKAVQNDSLQFIVQGCLNDAVAIFKYWNRYRPPKYNLLQVAKRVLYWLDVKRLTHEVNIILRRDLDFYNISEDDITYIFTTVGKLMRYDIVGYSLQDLYLILPPDKRIELCAQLIKYHHMFVPDDQFFVIRCDFVVISQEYFMTQWVAIHEVAEAYNREVIFEIDPPIDA